MSGGIENFLHDLTIAQKEMGAEPVVLVHNLEPFRKTARETWEDVEVIRAASFGSALYTPISPVFPFWLRKLFKHKPDLIHVHMPNPSAFWLLNMAQDVPVVIHWHSDVIAQASERALKTAYHFYHLFEKMLLDKAAAVIATSRDYLDSSPVLKDYVHKCHVIPLGLNPDRLKCYGSSFKKGKKFLIFSAGRFAGYKGFEYLIQSMKDIPDSLLVIAGEGKFFRDSLRLIDDLELGNRIKLTGYVSPGELCGLMNKCDVFCLPSVERTEAFGLVLLEAMYFAKPLVTTKIPGSGVNWVNQAGVTGLHVPPRDSIALAGAIKTLRNNDTLRQRMGINSVNRFNENFHITKVAEKIHQIYKYLVH